MKSARGILLAAFCAVLGACAPSFVQDRVFYNDLATAPGGVIGEGRTPAAERALAEIEKARKKNLYGSKDQLLLGMDLGMATHVAARYRESEKTFREANRLGEALFTKSFTDILLAYQLNDYSLPYKGLPYERVMINLVNSLNYAATGDWNGALVETRKIRRKLLSYNRMYPKAAGAAPGRYARYEGMARSLLDRHHIAYNPAQLNHYTDDAFARYLSGVFEEAQVESGAGSYQSAYLSYLKAERTYEKYALLYHTPVPSFLEPALLRTAEAAGRTNELARWKKVYAGQSYIRPGDYARMGHVLFVGYNGKIFHLTQDRFIFPLPLANTISMVSFAVPKPVGGGTDVRGHEIVVTSPGQPGVPVARVSSELGDDLMAIGATNFKDHLSRIILREAIRSTLKTVEQITAQEIARQEGSLAQILTMVGGGIFDVASDQADIRSWRLLPATIDAAMVDLPPGTYDLTVRTRTDFGPGGTMTERVTVGPGQYLLVRTVNPPPPSGPGKD
ncbi:MAG: hypothetical protein M1537_05480 [Nitrospirae bacterium]|nr:hypothetical protein [Nitrospirota bacterium]MCL5285199.1 hypothetical protein [Nitrospirota bacterium]